MPSLKPSARDEADIASEQEEFARQEALFKAARPAKLQLRGKCYNCSEPTDGHFCDVDCRRDWEREQQVRQKQGQARTTKEHAQ